MKTVVTICALVLASAFAHAEIPKILVLSSDIHAGKKIQSEFASLSPANPPLVLDNYGDAQRVIESFRPDIVIIERPGGGSDGVPGKIALKKIRSRYSDLPVIFMSTRPEAENLEMFKDAKAKPPHGFLQKPYKTEDLVRLVLTLYGAPGSLATSAR